MRRQCTITFIGIAALGLSVAAGAAWFGGFRVNITPSEPLGLWRIVTMNRPVENGDLVFACPPVNAFFQNALERGYLRRGLCPGGFAPLIKRVVAHSGQHVEVGADVTIDGTPLVNSTVRKNDGEGRAVTPFPGGVVPSGFVFLHSSFASSYDSRYFGPVPVDGLLGFARPVLVLDP
ncbi:conjugative transfer signal peptidase TraF [Phyllobacterium sp. YR531]|uniref:conjugative transfer signal peptidase TraF n=1 Tax=Phyllobacterium sp. YR531 TaxID=1144343 RepID=UPI00026FA971|nr:conjugative transfer signal peptidase TraF [Phyllobacterium sp. YR531]EJN05986.1 conjugative transfer signal peptidase TraF [Phyllobacterium sp. YR531]